ncbi:unnamed protein product [Danaus chrysippus]|uniref:(African queen) hypothetical protein n=1 Tax=Danaus chrysippus TaxID=151541 RepID=A0A8J2WB63_9NEOP|nr:unnamed protein product [Danaus chrysippus]
MVLRWTPGDSSGRLSGTVTTLAPVTETVVTHGGIKRQWNVQRWNVRRVNFVKTNSRLNPRTSSVFNVPTCRPTRPRYSYQRDYKGGFSKGGRRGYAKGGFSKTAYSKGTRITSTERKPLHWTSPALSSASQSKQQCGKVQVRAGAPPLPPGPGSTPAAVVCSAPTCPKQLRAQTGNTYHWRPTSGPHSQEMPIGGMSANELFVWQDDQIILVKPKPHDRVRQLRVHRIEQTSKILFPEEQLPTFNVSGVEYRLSPGNTNFTVCSTVQMETVKIGVRHWWTVFVGLFDGDSSNDRSLPDGRLAAGSRPFGRSWAKPGLSLTPAGTKVIPPEKNRSAFGNLCKVITAFVWKKICKCAELGYKRNQDELKRSVRCLLVEKLVAECLAADKEHRCDRLEDQRWAVVTAECPAPLVQSDCYRRGCEPSCAPITSGAARCDAAERTVLSTAVTVPTENSGREGTLVWRHLTVWTVPVLVWVLQPNTPHSRADDLPFLGNCNLPLYRGTDRRKGESQYQGTVYATNGPCEGAGGTCVTSLHVLRSCNTCFFCTSLRNPNTMKVLVLQSKLQFTVSVPSHDYSNRTEGLCGVCAGYQDQLVTSNGTVTDDFDLYGKSWQASPEVLTKLEVPPQEQCGDIPPPPPCVPPTARKQPVLQPENNVEKFGACHALVEPQPYIEQCESELCELNSTDACPVLERYAAECRKQGVSASTWRTDLCPYHGAIGEQHVVSNRASASHVIQRRNTTLETSGNANSQEDACTHCTCSKGGRERTGVVYNAHVREPPVCADGEERVPTVHATRRPAVRSTCAFLNHRTWSATNREEKMECGFGQVLKLKSKPDGCTEISFACKPESECEPIPDESEVEMLEPGMERVVDRSGLLSAGRRSYVGPRHAPPHPLVSCLTQPTYYQYHRPMLSKSRLDSAWLDGPCRSCRFCGVHGGGSRPHSVPRDLLPPPSPPPTSSCWNLDRCPSPAAVPEPLEKIGRHTSDPCESYQCSQVGEGQLEKVTTLQRTVTRTGWQYFPSEDSSQCCGRCRPVSCVVDGVTRDVGARWTSADFLYQLHLR